MSELEFDGKFQISTLSKTRHVGVTKMNHSVADFYLVSHLTLGKTIVCATGKHLIKNKYFLLTF